MGPEQKLDAARIFFQDVFGPAISIRRVMKSLVLCNHSTNLLNSLNKSRVVVDSESLPEPVDYCGTAHNQSIYSEFSVSPINIKKMH